VVVAADDLAAGERVTSGDLVAVRVNGGGDVLDRLLGEVPSIEMVAVRELAAGEPLRASDLVAAAASDKRLRRMSLPVDVEHAAGGRIAAGDRVDILAAIDGVATAIVTGAEIVAVADQQDRAFGTLGSFHVTVLVDAADALCLASALADGEIHLVLASGAEAAAATGCPS
jgi:Flp pilus assembly protein CpaB